MADERATTGGCYCGAIRYEATESPVGSGMCHCRMCQKWTGLAAAMGVFFPLESFRFTKGKPRTYMTSKILERSFCADCGTSIGHRYVAGELEDKMDVFIGTLDHPEDYDGPQGHFGIESHLTKWMVLADDVPKREADGTPWLADAWARVEGTPDVIQAEEMREGSDADAIRAVLAELEDAANERDAARVAALYLSDSDIWIAGRPTISGRDAIRRNEEEWYEQPGYRMTRITSVGDIRFIDTHVAVVNAEDKTILDEDREIRGEATLILVRRDQDWRIAGVRVMSLDEQL